MPGLTPKMVNGHTYYYARYCQRVNSKRKIVCQVYLRKIEYLVAAAERSQQPPQLLETGEAAFGDIAALFDIAQRLFQFGHSSDLAAPKNLHQIVSMKGFSSHNLRGLPRE